MRAVIQRVLRAEVEVDSQIVGLIGPGLVVMVAVCVGDTEKDLEFIGKKILQLRIFQDKQGKMDCSVLETGLSILLVSQVTLYGDCGKGNRPSYSRAAPPSVALREYNRLVRILRDSGAVVETGQFGSMMHLSLVNDGPVTLIVDSGRNLR